MTTKPIGTTLPDYPGIAFTNKEVRAGTDINGYKINYEGVSPINVISLPGTYPSSLILRAQSANGTTLSAGGNLVFYSGIGTDAGTTSGNWVFDNGIGTGGLWNKGHFVINSNFHIWLSASDRLRVHRGTLTADSNGQYLPAIHTTLSTVWDAPSIATAASSNTTVAMSGAAMGDHVLVSCSTDVQGLLLTAHVSSAGNVTINLLNGTGSSVDLASATYYLKLIKN